MLGNLGQRHLVTVALLLVSWGVPRAAPGAGITGFIESTSPGSRPGVGFAVAVPLFTEILSLEGEYSRSRAEEASPSLTMWSGNLLLVSPVEVLRLRPYFALGLGLYRQATVAASETSLTTSQGLGAFLRLGGPLHARLEYRAMRLQGEPLQDGQKRFYVGLTLRI